MENLASKQIQKLIVVIGPTAAKKSLVAVQLARALNGQIINGDAFQVYREINAGVNKPTPEIMAEIPHHLINCCSYQDGWNIAKFQTAFDDVYEQIRTVGAMPILCGGSHLYTDAVLKGYDLSKSMIDLTPFHTKTNAELLDFIEKYDPVSAKKIGSNNRKRLLRCAAIIQANDFQAKSVTDQIGNHTKYLPLVIMVTQDRELLYQKINNRFDQMYANGWREEVIRLVQQDQEIVNSQAFKAIGYREIAASYQNNTPLNLEDLKAKTRHLAKRQLTWCRNKFPNKIVFDITKDDFEQLKQTVADFWNDPSPLPAHPVL